MIKWNKYPDVTPLNNTRVIVLIDGYMQPLEAIYLEEDGFVWETCCMGTPIKEKVVYYIENIKLEVPEDWKKGYPHSRGSSPIIMIEKVD